MTTYAQQIAEAVREAAAKICDEYREITAAEKDSALLVGKVELSNAMSGEPRAAEFLADAIRSLDLDAIIASVPEPWISVKDRLPEQGNYLVTANTDDGPETMQMFYRGDCWLYENQPTFCHSFYIEVTHYQPMPLPAAPTEGKP